MTAYKALSREELKQVKEELEQQFAEVRARGLKMDMSRGKPSAEQLELSVGMLDTVKSKSSLLCENGMDARNYGILDGIPRRRNCLRI